jgi:hypothetical protein
MPSKVLSNALTEVSNPLLWVKSLTPAGCQVANQKADAPGNNH